MKKIIRADTAAVAFFVLFLVANALKCALFHDAMTDRTSMVASCLHHPGFYSKLFFTAFLCIVLLRWKKPFLFVLFYAIQLAYMYTNVSYHSYFDGYLHINQYIGLFSEGFELAKHGGLPQNSNNWFLLTDAPFFIGMLFVYPKISFLNKRYIRWKAAIALCAVFVFLFCKVGFFGGISKHLALMDDQYSSDREIVRKYGLLAYTIADALKFRDTQSRIKRLNYGREIAVDSADSTHPNFIIIQVESMDSHIINRRHKKSYVMPFLHSLTKKCIFYPYVLSYHKAGSTSDCEFSVINSVEPFDDYPAMKLRDYNYPNSMLKPLRDAGYDVAAFHGNRGTYFNRNVALKKMGCMKFYDISAMGLKEKGWGASDGDVFDYMKSKLRDQRRPFLYYCITMSSHEPFTFANLYYSTRAFNDIRNAAAKNYLVSMSYVDCELKRFIRHIRDSCANTYIFIYGDHTPPIIKKDIYQRAAFTDNGKLFEFVPLMILAPEKKAYREKKRIASFLDIAPTVLLAAKVSFTIRSIGTNLFPSTGDDEAIPYKGALYCRKELFKRIRNTMQ